MKNFNIYSIKKLMGISFLATSLFFITNTGFAQEGDTKIRFGIKGGVNLSNLYIDDVNDEKAKFGLHGGLWAKVPLGEFFAVQPELLFTTAGSKIASYSNVPFTQDGEINFNLNYIQLPVLASVTLGPISLQAGPYISYLASANVKNVKVDSNGIPTDNNNSSGRELDRDDFNSVDYGLAGGIAVDIKGFQLGARYNYGLNNIGQNDIAGQLTKNSKNSVAQIFVGIGF